MYIDKQFAIKQKKRIPENVLLFFAFIGGSIGTIMAMYVCHHKTRKKKFSVGIWLIIIVQCILYYIIRSNL